MSHQGLIYSFVAKGTVVLAEHTSFSGNFCTIAVQCLQKLTPNSSKYTYSCDGYTFNFLIDNGFVFLVVADESTGRSVPFVFLERVKDDFKQRYGASIRNDDRSTLADDDEDEDLFEDSFNIAYNLDREFGPRLKEHMQYCMKHPEEISKLSKLKVQITEVKGIMMDNIEKLVSPVVSSCYENFQGHSKVVTVTWTTKDRELHSNDQVWSQLVTADWETPQRLPVTRCRVGGRERLSIQVSRPVVWYVLGLVCQKNVFETNKKVRAALMRDC